MFSRLRSKNNFMPEERPKVYVHLHGFSTAESESFKAYLREQEGVEDVRRRMLKFASAQHIIPLVIFVGESIASGAIGCAISWAAEWVKKRRKEQPHGGEGDEELVIYDADGEIAKVISVSKKRKSGERHD
jgi:hypothetical protein